MKLKILSQQIRFNLLTQNKLDWVFHFLKEPFEFLKETLLMTVSNLSVKIKSITLQKMKMLPYQQEQLLILLLMSMLSQNKHTKTTVIRQK